MKKAWFLFFLFPLLFCAQSKKLDSLKLELTKAKHDTARFELMILISDNTEDPAAARKLFASSVAFPKRPPLSLAVVMKQDLLVDLAHDVRFRESAFVKAVNPAVFAVLPVVVNRLLVGVLYADRTTACQTDGLLPRLGKIRDALCHALTLVR